MKILKKEEINTLYSRTWVACNDDSKSKQYKIEFLRKFGGEFIESGKYSKWQKKQPPVKIYVPLRLLKFIDNTGKVIEIDHMTDYCLERKLSRSAMYEVLSGVRKSYKGYKALPLPTSPSLDTDIEV